MISARRHERYLSALKYGKKTENLCRNQELQKIIRNIGNQVALTLVRKQIGDSEN